MGAAPQKDLSGLQSGGVAAARGNCLRCGRPLAAEPWWVTAYPHGEHTRCRDWSRSPFPFERHLGVLRRVWREPGYREARGRVAEVGGWLAEQARVWPQGGAAAVGEALERLHALRTTLAEAGVPRAWLSQF